MVEDRESQLAWQTVKEVSNRKITSIAKLKAARQEERFQKWKEHWKPPWNYWQTYTTNYQWPSRNQTRTAYGSRTWCSIVKKKFLNRKAAGLDKISSEVWVKVWWHNFAIIQHRLHPSLSKKGEPQNPLTPITA